LSICNLRWLIQLIPSFELSELDDSLGSNSVSSTIY
jgi:hypothetical protein